MSIVRIEKVIMVKKRRELIRDLPVHICGTCRQRFLDSSAAARVERRLGLSRRGRRASTRAA